MNKTKLALDNLNLTFKYRIFCVMKKWKSLCSNYKKVNTLCRAIEISALGSTFTQLKNSANGAKKDSEKKLKATLPVINNFCAKKQSCYLLTAFLVNKKHLIKNKTRRLGFSKWKEYFATHKAIGNLVMRSKIQELFTRLNFFYLFKMNSYYKQLKNSKLTLLKLLKNLKLKHYWKKWKPQNTDTLRSFNTVETCDTYRLLSPKPPLPRKL